MSSDYVNSQEILSILGISYPTLQRYKKDGLPYLKSGRQDLFHVETVEKWLNARRKKPHLELDTQLVVQYIERIRKLTEREQVAILSPFLMTRKDVIQALGIAGKTVDDLGKSQAILPVVRGVYLRTSVERRIKELRKKRNSQALENLNLEE